MMGRVGLVALFGGVIVGVNGHGYTSSPPTRGAYCRSGGGSGSAGCLNLQSTGQSEAIYTPQGICYQNRQINYLTDYMTALPDGKICSAAGNFPGLDLAGNNWHASALEVKNGNQAEITYTFTAYHPSDHIAFYITKPGTDHNGPLKKSDLQLIGKVTNIAKTDELRSTVTIPGGLNGRATIVTFWLVSTGHGTGENFISCSDVNVNGNTSLPGNDTPIPPPIQEPVLPPPQSPGDGGDEPIDCIHDADIHPWQPGSYQGGDVVKGTDGKAYECKEFPASGWCGQNAAYQPVSGFGWQDAWTPL